MKKLSLIFLATVIALFPFTNCHTNPTKNTVNALENSEVKEQKLKQEKKKDNKNIKEQEEVIKKESNKQRDTKQQIKENNKSQVVEKTEITQQPPVDQLTEIKYRNDSLGSAGRLYIPEVKISLGIYHANFYDTENYNAQAIVDKEDSAAYFIFSNKTTIADHSHQGFSKIANLSNAAQAYIKRSDGVVEVYQLVNKFAGRNIGYDLIDTTGNSVQNMNGSLIMYTCYGLNNGVMITLWNRIA